MDKRNFNIIFILFANAIFLFFILPIIRAEIPMQVENLYSEPGKFFIYTAKKFGITILHATIRIGNKSIYHGKPTIQIEAVVCSLPHTTFLFRMNNRFISMVDAETLLPIQYIKEIDQDGVLIKKKNYVQTHKFNHHDHKVIVEKSLSKEKQEIHLPPSTYDPLTIFLIYHLKDEFSPEREINLSVYDGVKVRQMVFHSKKEVLKFKEIDELNVLCIESETSFSTFSEKEGTIRIWVTDNPKRIPVAIELILPVGKIKFELEEVREIK
jgi:hypothetical protein